MQAYCQKAANYGSEPLPPNVKARHITVILNPNANKRKSTKEFEKYCAPLLHLAGIFIEVIKTESEGHAKTLMDTLGGTDAIVVAGGDGTLSEVVTGILRKTEENTSHLIPLGNQTVRSHDLRINYLYFRYSSARKEKLNSKIFVFK